MPKRKVNNKKQMGGELKYPKGLLKGVGSGRIDPTSKDGLPVDDVPALLGEGEYVLNANAVKEVGVPFLDNLNATGLGNSTLPRGTGRYGNYQGGGLVTRNSRIQNNRGNVGPIDAFGNTGRAKKYGGGRGPMGEEV